MFFNLIFFLQFFKDRIRRSKIIRIRNTEKEIVFGLVPESEVKYCKTLDLFCFTYMFIVHFSSFGLKYKSEISKKDHLLIRNLGSGS